MKGESWCCSDTDTASASAFIIIIFFFFIIFIIIILLLLFIVVIIIIILIIIIIQVPIQVPCCFMLPCHPPATVGPRRSPPPVRFPPAAQGTTAQHPRWGTPKGFWGVFNLTWNYASWLGSVVTNPFPELGYIPHVNGLYRNAHYPTFSLWSTSKYEVHVVNPKPWTIPNDSPEIGGSHPKIGGSSSCLQHFSGFLWKYALLGERDKYSTWGVQFEV